MHSLNSAMKDARNQTPTCVPCFRKCSPQRNSTEMNVAHDDTGNRLEFIILLYSKDGTQWPNTQGLGYS